MAAVGKSRRQATGTIMGNISFGGMVEMERGRWVCRLGHRKVKKFYDGFCSCCEVDWTI